VAGVLAVYSTTQGKYTIKETIQNQSTHNTKYNTIQYTKKPIKVKLSLQQAVEAYRVVRF
jgi:vacuolar-type H+-ATPase catalytic subunit A/Vma1